ncbi:MAG: protein kinase [Minicystis sp.]
MKSGEIVAGKYRLEVRLGVGGMGEVWKASHTATGRHFALKFMHAHAALSRTARQRFAREARVSAKINHPNVIDIFDVGEVGENILFLAMELLEGVSLADALHAREPLTAQAFLTVMLDTARALAAAHAAMVVHRDVKPGNIFLHRDPETGYASAKILDFGISKLTGIDDSHHTKTGAVLGSPRYMSPEQTRSAAGVDHRTDLWSLGVILFEGLTGTWPHDGDSFTSLVVAICTMPPASIDRMAPDLPEGLRSVVRDCLKPIGERVQSAAEIEARLGAVVLDPSLAQLTLPRPRHAPNESVRSVSSVRIRPPLLTTTSGVTMPMSGAPDSLRTTEVHRDRAAPQMAEPSEYQEDDATRIRPLAPLVRSATFTGDYEVPIAPVAPPAEPQAPLVQPPPAEALPPTPPPPPAGVSAGPVFRPHVKTMPMQSAAILQAELARAGLVPEAPRPPMPSYSQMTPPSQPAPLPEAPLPQTTKMPQVTPLQSMASSPQTAKMPQVAPLQQAAPLQSPQTVPPFAAAGSDPLIGTVSRMSFETRASIAPDSQAPMPAPSLMPSPVSPSAAPAGPQRAKSKSLGVIAAVLSVLLLGIIGALVSVLRSAPPPAAAASDGSAPVSARPPAPPLAATSAASSAATATAAPSASAAPTASAAATATASAASTALPATSAAPADKPKAGGAGRPPAPKGPSKIQQLGSGL